MKFYRLIIILYVIARYRLDKLIPQKRLPSFARFLLRLLPLWLFPLGQKSRGIRLRLALIALGPIFIKFGQMLSTRRDLFPADIIDELQKLQDQVPSFSSKLARQIVEKELNRPIDDIFSEFSETPLASASVAQVHAAKLFNGDNVIVKIIRPGIDKIIHIDTALMKSVARFLMYFPEFHRLRPMEVVQDYRLTLLDELDLHKEAANISQLKRNFANSPLLYVPSIYWPLTRKHVMVEERIYGIAITALDQLNAAKVNMKMLAERGVEIFFTQVFRDNFFHADMHPGNIFIDASQPLTPSYIAIDCGIVGSLTQEDQDYLARNILAFFHHDYYEVAMLHIRSGWVSPSTRVNEFAAAVRTVCEPLFEKPLKDISFGQALLGLFQTARRFDMQVQPQLILLQKTLLNIEGLGRMLYPELDLWHTAKPFLENWMKKRSGIQSFWRSLKHQAPDLALMTPELPFLVHQALTYYVQNANSKQPPVYKQATKPRITKSLFSSRMSRLGLLLLLISLGWQFWQRWWQQNHIILIIMVAISLWLIIYR